jgi:type VI protein secretion system component VasF
MTIIPPWAVALGIVAVIAALMLMVLLAFRDDRED